MTNKINPITKKWEKSKGISFGRIFLKGAQTGSVKEEIFLAQGW